MLKQGLAPIADASTRLFILGSLPGERSLEEGRYYAFPTNQFWKLVGPVIGENLQAMDYDARLAALRAHGIGLWDVVSAARREGSGDQAIRDAKHNDIGGLRRDYPELKAIAFNGGRAAKDGLRLLAGVEGLNLLALPSSSAANARMALAEKARAWAALGQFLRR
ncbi:MAG TPA: DNA-deoxyinosine glycosylase [Roseiarcus sp.]|nr:DNA-deoxyinosine glycosylase [Roseiarcus sp.]